MKNKIEITIAQALLLLIAHEDNTVLCERLKRLFFLGAQTDTERDEIKALCQQPLIQDSYTVSFPPAPGQPAYEAQRLRHYHLINKDAVRRYFETSLAYETLHANPMKELSVKQLQTHVAKLESMLLKNIGYKRNLYTTQEQTTLPETFLEVAQNILKGDFTHVREPVTPAENFCREYEETLRQLASEKPYAGFDAEQRLKMSLLFRASFYCVNLLRNIPNPPLTRPVDVYRTGFYHQNNRGIVSKENAVESSSFGLMLSYMWLPEEDPGRSATLFSTLRVADRNTFDPDAEWVKDNFSHFVHPFSCSISGTLLMLFKIFIQLQSDRNLVFNTYDKFHCFLKSFIPLLLFNSGGHTFHEFMYPLRLPKIRQAFSFIEGFERLNNETVFMLQNEKPFDQAIDKAILYNQQYLKRKALHQNMLEDAKPLKQKMPPIETCGIQLGRPVSFFNPQTPLIAFDVEPINDNTLNA